MRIYGTLETKCFVKSKASGKCKKGSGNTDDLGNNATVSTFRKKASNGVPFGEVERFNPSKPFHPGPLKLEIKSIRNSTRVDTAAIAANSLAANEEGRSLITAGVLLLWIFIWKTKAYISFFIVHTIDFIWTSIKNILGWGNEHYETTITLGHEHPPHKGHGHKGLLGHHHHETNYGWSGYGNSLGPQGGHHKRWVYKTKNPWYHPATHLFEQPSIQYLPHGKEHMLLGYDAHQAYKYRRKYGKKFAHYRRKYFRKKGKEIIKAQRQRDREKKKAARRRKKAARRKEKWERFKERVKEAQNWVDNLKQSNGGDEDHDGEEHNDDLKSGDHPKEVKKKDDTGKEANQSDLKSANDSKGKDAKKNEDKTEEQQDAKNDKDEKRANDETDEHDDEEENDASDESEEEIKDNKKVKGDKEEAVDDLKDGDKQHGDEEDDIDDLAYDDKSWEEPSSEIEHGKPPHISSVSSYHHGQDYDPLPSKSKNQKYIRIRV